MLAAGKLPLPFILCVATASRIAFASRFRTDESLANPPQCQAGLFFGQSRFHALDRLPHRFVAEPKSLMMHRHYILCVAPIGHLHRLLRCAMIPNPWIVCADWHDGRFERPICAMLFEEFAVGGIACE